MSKSAKPSDLQRFTSEFELFRNHDKLVVQKNCSSAVTDQINVFTAVTVAHLSEISLSVPIFST